MIDTKNNPPRDLLVYQVSREFISLSKYFLILLEDLREQNIIGEDEFSKYRKKILDSGNDSIRNLSSFIDKFDIKLAN